MEGKEEKKRKKKRRQVRRKDRTEPDQTTNRHYYHGIMYDIFGQSLFSCNLKRIATEPQTKVVISAITLSQYNTLSKVCWDIGTLGKCNNQNNLKDSHAAAPVTLYRGEKLKIPPHPLNVLQGLMLLRQKNTAAS